MLRDLSCFHERLIEPMTYSNANAKSDTGFGVARSSRRPRHCVIGRCWPRMPTEQRFEDVLDSLQPVRDRVARISYEYHL